MKIEHSVQSPSRQGPDPSGEGPASVPLGLFWARAAVGMCALTTLMSALVVLSELYFVMSYIFDRANPLRHEYGTGLWMSAIYGGIFVGLPTLFFAGAELAPSWLTRLARTSVAIIVAVFLIALAAFSFLPQ